MSTSPRIIELFIAENKSFDPVRFYGNKIKVCINKRYNQGFWIDEYRLFDLLTTEQKKQYLLDRSPKARYYDLTLEVAQRVVDAGISRTKRTLT